MSTAPRPTPAIGPAEVFSWGYQGVPLRDKAPRAEKGWNTRPYRPSDWRPDEGTGIRTGRQPDSTCFYVVDLDSHKPGQDAPAEYDRILSFLPPELRCKLFGARSTGGMGRYIAFRSRRLLRTRQLHDSQGRHIGELLGEGSQVVAPGRDRWLFGDLGALQLLTEDELRVVLAVCGYHDQGEASHHSGARLTFDWERPRLHLAHIPALMRRVKPHTLTYKMLHGQDITNRSDARFMLACELRKRFGFPSDEAAAILLHYTDWDHTREKGSAWLEDDIVRCVGEAERRYPDARTSPTRYQATHAAVELPPETKPEPRGRPRALDPYTYLDWLIDRADCGKVMLTRQECAGALGISPATIDRLEAALRADGRIQRHTARKKHRPSLSWVELLGVIKNTAPAPAPAPAPTLEPAVEVSSDPQRIKERACVKEEHTAEEETPVPVSRAPEVWMRTGRAVTSPGRAGHSVQLRLVSVPRRRVAEQRAREAGPLSEHEERAAEPCPEGNGRGASYDPASATFDPARAADRKAWRHRLSPKDFYTVYHAEADITARWHAPLRRPAGVQAGFDLGAGPALAPPRCVPPQVPDGPRSPTIHTELRR